MPLVAPVCLCENVFVTATRPLIKHNIFIRMMLFLLHHYTHTHTHTASARRLVCVAHIITNITCTYMIYICAEETAVHALVCRKDNGIRQTHTHNSDDDSEIFVSYVRLNHATGRTWCANAHTYKYTYRNIAAAHHSHTCMQVADKIEATCIQHARGTAGNCKAWSHAHTLQTHSGRQIYVLAHTDGDG